MKSAFISMWKSIDKQLTFSLLFYAVFLCSVSTPPNGVFPGAGSSPVYGLAQCSVRSNCSRDNRVHAEFQSFPFLSLCPTSQCNSSDLTLQHWISFVVLLNFLCCTFEYPLLVFWKLQCCRVATLQPTQLEKNRRCSTWCFISPIDCLLSKYLNIYYYYHEL